MKTHGDPALLHLSIDQLAADSTNDQPHLASLDSLPTTSYSATNVTLDAAKSHLYATSGVDFFQDAAVTRPSSFVSTEFLSDSDLAMNSNNF